MIPRKPNSPKTNTLQPEVPDSYSPKSKKNLEKMMILPASTQ